jgi:hypothetical protein
MADKRPKVEPIRNPTLFPMEKLEEAATPANTLPLDRPFSLPGILLGTSAFTANGWQGSFYPKGMRSTDYLAFYATQFPTVEVDSTFYGCPSPSTVNNWANRTPQDFVFCVKVPQICCGPSYVVLISHRIVSRGIGVEQHHITSSRHWKPCHVRGWRVLHDWGLASAPHALHRGYKLRRNCIRLGSSRHFNRVLVGSTPGSQAASACAFIAKSVSA